MYTMISSNDLEPADIATIIQFTLYLLDKGNTEMVKVGSEAWNDARIKLMEAVSSLVLDRMVRYIQQERDFNKRIAKVCSGMLMADLGHEDGHYDDESDLDSARERSDSKSKEESDND